MDSTLRDVRRADADDCAARTRPRSPHLRNHGPNMIFKLAIVAAGLLTAGLVFTAMRTVIVAFVIGASDGVAVVARTMKVVFTFALFAVLASAVVVWQTRDRNALLLGDPSSSLRYQVARVGLSRILIHPCLGMAWTRCSCTGTSGAFPAKTCFTCTRLRYNSRSIADCRCSRFGCG